MTLVFVVGSPLEQGQVVGILGFWIIGIFLILAIMTMRIEIEGDEVRSYLLSFRILKLQPSDVKSIIYGNLMKGGLGLGKGLIIQTTVKGRSKRLTIGEKLYGKEAIDNIRRILDNS